MCVKVCVEETRCRDEQLWTSLSVSPFLRKQLMFNAFWRDAEFEEEFQSQKRSNREREKEEEEEEEELQDIQLLPPGSDESLWKNSLIHDEFFREGFLDSSLRLWMWKRVFLRRRSEETVTETFISSVLLFNASGIRLKQD